MLTNAISAGISASVTTPAETGMDAILHTWGQNLSLHPYVHCVVPGGGYQFLRAMETGKDLSKREGIFVQGRKPFR